MYAAFSVHRASSKSLQSFTDENKYDTQSIVRCLDATIIASFATGHPSRTKYRNTAIFFSSDAAAVVDISSNGHRNSSRNAFTTFSRALPATTLKNVSAVSGKPLRSIARRKYSEVVISSTSFTSSRRVFPSSIARKQNLLHRAKFDAFNRSCTSPSRYLVRASPRSGTIFAKNTSLFLSMKLNNGEEVKEVSSSPSTSSSRVPIARKKETRALSLSFLTALSHLFFAFLFSLSISISRVKNVDNGLCFFGKKKFGKSAA
jgi:hypothetical protein